MTTDINYEVIPKVDNQLYEERELQRSHTPFQQELHIFRCIGQGDVKSVSQGFDDYMSSVIVMGQMSKNSDRQIKYWAVSGIAVAVHYAILGGVDETDAFNLSDECISYVDEENDETAIFAYLKDKLIDLTYMVYYSRMKNVKSLVVKRALHYIYLNLHHRISLDELSKECMISKNYLCAHFKKEMGVTVMDYVTGERLKAADIRLEQGASISGVAYEFGFCSETHFIERYKKYYGVTPGMRNTQ